jgi:adenosylcobinamide-phosphate synthase
MIMTSLHVLLAFGIDLLVGDPPRRSHPVVIIGKTIEFLEPVLRPITHLASDKNSKGMERLMGSVLTVTVTVGSFLACRWAIDLLNSVSPTLGGLLSLWLLSTTIAARDLREAAYKVYYPVAEGDLESARDNLQMIVGRDTGNLGVHEIVRGAVETVAENTSDGVIAPLFYGFLGGAPLAMAYKAVNTLDSMVGYKNEKYLNFGWASAKLDDLANYVPARITGTLLVIASFILGFDCKRAAETIRRSAYKHPSPNSGVCEAAVAGALGVRLGGLNFYGGEPSFRSYIGEPVDSLEPRHIRDAVRLMYLASALAVGMETVMLLFWNYAMGGRYSLVRLGTTGCINGCICTLPLCLEGHYGRK